MLSCFGTPYQTGKQFTLNAPMRVSPRSHVIGKIFSPVVLTVLLLIPGWTQAETHPGTVAIGPAIGWVAPRSDLAEVIDAAFSVGGALDYQINSGIGLGVDLMFFDERFTGQDDGASDKAAWQGMIQATGQLRWSLNPQAMTVPFINIGSGAYVGIKRTGSGVDGDKRARLGANLGGGVEFTVNPTMDISLELSYHVIFDESELSTYSYGPSQYISIRGVLLFNNP
jgi:opacity protein-like surface antigen